MFKLPATTVLAFLGLAFLLPFPEKANASEKVFLDHKCNKCHAVSAYGIHKLNEDAEEEEEPEESERKSSVPDLSDVGTYVDVSYLKAYLKKEVPVKHRDGKEGTAKHRVKFKGSDEELTDLANWLVTLKKAPK